MEDIAPLSVEHRTWRWHTYVTMWVALGANPAIYSFGSALLGLGLSPVDALVLLVVGLVFIAGATVLNSAAGVTYGIPFPVYARASFGVEGAKYAALSRGVVGIMWLSFQFWASTEALVQGLAQLVGSDAVSGAELWRPYLSATQLICFLLVALMHIGCLAIGVKYFQRLTYIFAPVGIIFFLLIALWATMPYFGGQGLEATLHANVGDAGEGYGGFQWIAWLTGLNSLIGLYSTLMLNMADLARLAPTQKDQVLGQMLGIPIPGVFGCGVGILGAASIQLRSGKASWFITGPFDYWPAWVSMVAAIALVMLTLSVNISANIIPPANDLMNLFPQRLRWRWCAYGTVGLACVICPWVLFHTAEGFVVQFLGGYGMVTGAIYGVMVSDYYVVRGGQLNLADLYPSQPGEGAFQYWRGHNWRASVATLAGISLPFPAFVAGLIGVEDMPAFFTFCGHVSWFVACAVALLVYLLMCWWSPPPQSLQATKKLSDNVAPATPNKDADQSSTIDPGSEASDMTMSTV